MNIVYTCTVCYVGQFSSSNAETREATVGLVHVLSSQTSDPEVCVKMLQLLISLLQGKGELYSSGALAL